MKTLHFKMVCFRFFPTVEDGFQASLVSRQDNVVMNFSPHKKKIL